MLPTPFFLFPPSRLFSQPAQLSIALLPVNSFDLARAHASPTKGLPLLTSLLLLNLILRSCCWLDYAFNMDYAFNIYAAPIASLIGSSIFVLLARTSSGRFFPLASSGRFFHLFMSSGRFFPLTSSGRFFPLHSHLHFQLFDVALQGSLLCALFHPLRRIGI
jgi:hypothetical protein